MIRKTRQVSSAVKSGGAAKRFSFKSFGIMGVCLREGNAAAGNPGPGPGVKGLEEKTMRNVSPVERLAQAAPVPGCPVKREDGGDRVLVRPR